MEIRIDLPGLTSEIAAELDRAADLAGAPFVFHPSQRAGLLGRTDLGPGVEMKDVRQDPSLGSETLDCADGWPTDPSLRAWLLRAMSHLAERAPEGRFTFQAGWNEHVPPDAEVTLDIASFLERIDAGRLRSRERYDVRVRTAGV